MTRPTVPLDDYGDDRPEPRASTSDRLAAAAPAIALLALVAAIAALGLAFLGRGDDLASCRRSAWTAIPSKDDLPDGWSLGSTDLNANGMTISIVGQASADDSSAPPVVYASVTCYGDVARDALVQNRTAAEAAGAAVTSRGGSADAYDVDNPATGSVTTLFRVGPLVGQVADAGSATPEDLAAITEAVAVAMGDRAAAGSPRPVSSDAAEGSAAPEGSGDVTEEPSASSVAPDLEAKLPKEIGGTTLSVDSATADVLLGNFPNSAAFGAQIRALGSSMTDLLVAEAYDDSGTVDLTVDAFRLPGKDVKKLRSAVIGTWLSANGAGVKQSEVTLSGKKLTKIDYGPDNATQYVYTGSDYVITIETSDPAVATEVASKIK